MDDAAVGGGERGEALVGDRFAAGDAAAVGAVDEALQGAIDQLQLRLQGVGQRAVLALLAGHEAAVGEVVLELEVDLSADREFVESSGEMRALLLEGGPDGVHVRSHARTVRTVAVPHPGRKSRVPCRTVAPMSASATDPTDGYVDHVRAARAGERRGVALFRGLAERRSDEREIALLDALTRLEEVTGSLLDQLLRSIDPTAGAEPSHAVVDPRVEALASRAWRDLMAWLHALVEPLIPRFQVAEALAPADDRWVLELFTLHEVALLDFAAAQLADPTGDAGLDAIEAAIDRIVVVS